MNVRWGGYTIVQAELLLLREAMKNPEISYVHIISGQDWPAKPTKEIFDFYDATDCIFLRHDKAEGIVKSHEPIEWWMKYYFHYDKMNRKSLVGKLYHRWTILWQTLKRTDKLKDLGITLDLQQGSNWCDLPRDAVAYTLDYLEKHPNVETMMQTGFCSDEFVYQTILCNSPLKDRIVNENHRYILWQKKYENYPAVLDESDLPAIRSGDYHFIRKVDLKISERLVRELSTKKYEDFIKRKRKR